MRITVQAHAKINLHLRILGRRADGYHDVVTVLQSLALHDTLTCESRPGPFDIRCDHPDVPRDSSNLVWRAARLLASHAGRPEPADTVVAIDKRIPMQAGLGGGSADAAAALSALARLWEIPLGEEALVALARQLGADVAFCVRGGTALGLGRGDELYPLPAFPSHAALVVMPPFGVSTPDAYRWHDERVEALEGASGGDAAPPSGGQPGEAAGERAESGGAAPGAAMSDWPAAAAGWGTMLPRLFNDFETVVGARFPEVPETVGALRRASSAFAMMSGSGAAIVGLFGDEGDAVRAAEEFVRPGWRTFVTRTGC